MNDGVFCKLWDDNHWQKYHYPIFSTLDIDDYYYLNNFVVARLVGSAKAYLNYTFTFSETINIGSNDITKIYSKIYLSLNKFPLHNIW